MRNLSRAKAISLLAGAMVAASAVAIVASSGGLHSRYMNVVFWIGLGAIALTGSYLGSFLRHAS